MLNFITRVLLRDRSVRRPGQSIHRTGIQAEVVEVAWPTVAGPIARVATMTGF
jgi:hypothetical protein